MTRPTITFIKAEFADGSSFEIEHSPIEGQSGTSYTPGNDRTGYMANSQPAVDLEAAINDAVNRLRLYPDADLLMSWCGALGGTQVNVHARFDNERERVTVDHDTLVVMAKGVLDNVMVDEQHSRWDAASLLNLVPDEEGRFDITEVAGGFASLEQQVIIG